jgi:hypothetical protein
MTTEVVQAVSCARPSMPSDKPRGNAVETQVRWLDDVAGHDYDAAQAYLSLKLEEDAASKIVARLRKAQVTVRRANDILRAARLTAAPLDDPGVMRDLKKVLEGKKLSPVLVVSGAAGADIADGYHRISLVYQLDPYGEVRLKLA